MNKKRPDKKPPTPRVSTKPPPKGAFMKQISHNMKRITQKRGWK